MPPAKVWGKLHQERFAGLPADCGNETEPGVIYNENLRDWSDKATTPDQRRIEHYIDRFDLRKKRILHVGIGNSGLAKRLHRRVGEIVGTTIDQPEIDVSRPLAISNYSVVRHNKYSGNSKDLGGKFDLIIDNNLTSPCCCMRHLGDMLELYRDKLKAGGEVVTDRLGLGWVPDGSNPRWRFNFEDLAAVASAAGLSAYRINSNTYVLSRSAPARPSFTSVARYLGRRARMLPGQAIRHGPRIISAACGRSVGKLLASVPRAFPGRYGKRT